MSALDDELLLIPELPELRDDEVVCDTCHLTYHKGLPACVNICLEES